MQSPKSRFLRMVLAASVATAAMLSGTQVLAKDLVIALRSEPTSMDPHYHALTSNIQVTQTLFDPLVCRDAVMAPKPCLAESWSVDGNVWTFKLRPDVKFSDGSPLTAEDVVFSLKRVPLVPNSPSPLTIYLQQVVNVEAVDPLTVRITTAEPYPLVPNNMAGLPIMSAKAAAGPAPEGKTTTQLNSGDGLVGTGPYRFVSWRRGSELIFERNPYYWGEKPAWDRVIYRPINNPASRIAALQAGDVDFVEDPPVEDLKRLQDNPNMRVVVQGPSYRLVYIGLDSDRDNPPGITGTNGVNPLKDHRVREAMSLAIDRKALVERVMNGMATPAAQLSPYPMFGASKEMMEVPAANVERAKALLAEAGFPNGFTLVLGSPNGRYMNDVKVAQTLAAMWARIGIKTSVDASAPSVFFSKAQNLSYSAYLIGWGAGSGEMSNPLTALVMTVDKERGQGTTNYAHYSNPEIDKIVMQARSELDDEKRLALLQQGNKMAMADFALLPIHFEHSVWAMKRDIDYKGRMDQMTMALEITPAK